MAEQNDEKVAGIAYQVIGSLAYAAGLFDHPEVLRALDYFGGYKAGQVEKEDLLPWGAGLPKPPNSDEMKARIRDALNLRNTSERSCARR